MRGSLLVVGWACLVGLLFCLSTLASDVVPFVAGYDRFYATSKVPQAEAGQLLLTELSCTACHLADQDKRLTAKGGPNLKGVGTRLDPHWIRNYLNSPSDIKPGGLMPHLLHQLENSERSRAIDALVAFLSTTAVVEPKIVASGSHPVAHEFWLKGNVDTGRTLYHQVGCVACHAIDESFQAKNAVKSDLERRIESLGLDPDELEEMGLVVPKAVQPIPLSDISTKYSLRSLSMFLMSPTLVRPSGRMPSLKLQPHEAADLAAYLHRRQSDANSRVRSDRSTQMANQDIATHGELVSQGKTYFEKLACANCHPLDKVEPLFARPLSKLDVSGEWRGCLADATNGPRFGLSTDQKLALKTGIAGWQKSTSIGEAETLSFKLLQFNCYACHERNGKGGLGPQQWPFFENVQQVDIGDEGRMPPPLDHVGFKLTKGWIQKILEGTGDVRPHFRARMPLFADQAKYFATAFEKVDKVRQATQTSHSTMALTPKVELEAGRALFDSGCVQCHPLRGETLPGTIGIDLADIGTRLNPDWFREFLLNPAGLKKNTRMPSFFPDGKSSNPGILQGDVQRQMVSIWSYLNSKDQPLPPKLEQSRSEYFALKPMDKPIVLRTFMESDSAGTHAIAVGFSESYHFAFDARRMRLAEIWKGGFLNAQGTWFDRFAPPAIPLGDRRVLFPRVSFFIAVTGSDFRGIDTNQLRFHGYRLDSHGIPTFRYSVADTVIEDRMEAELNVGFKRKLTVVASDGEDKPTSDSTWLLVADDILASKAASPYTTRSKVKISVSNTADQRFRANDDPTELMIKIPGEPASIEVGYRW